MHKIANEKKYIYSSSILICCEFDMKQSVRVTNEREKERYKVENAAQIYMSPNARSINKHRIFVQTSNVKLIKPIIRLH